MRAAPAADAGIVARLELARRLALDTGRQAEAFRRTADPAALAVSTKSLQDFVSAADRQSEETIRAALADAFPQDGFLGEETGGEPNADGFWVVDPIDGTANYIRGLRHWGVSIAFVRDGAVQLGCIYDAAGDRVYSALPGQGAFCGDRPVRVSGMADPTQALAIVGYSRRTPFEPYQALLARFHELGIEYRRLGSAALGLVRVADGIADLYYEAHLNSWDILAGALIAAEAGAYVAMPPLDRIIANGGAVAACTPGLAGTLDFLWEQLAESPVDGAQPKPTRLA